MFKFLWWVPLAAGFQDGINPCILITAALTLLGMLWLKKYGLKEKWILLFLLTVFVCSCVLNLGYLDRYILQKNFINSARCCYVFLALIIGWKGFQFLFDWIRLVQNQECAEVKVKKTISPVLLFFVMVVSGSVLSLLAALWPVNYYVTVFSMQLRDPSQFILMLFFVLSYTFMSLWVVYLVLALSFGHVKNVRLLKIVSAAVLLSASFSVIDLFL